MKQFLAAAFIFILAFTSLPSTQAQASLDPLSDRVLQSVIHLTGTLTDEGMIHVFGCSAFSIAPRKLMTAAHCIPSGLMTLFANKHPAYPIKIDVDRDLAILLWDVETPNLTFRQQPLSRYEPAIAFGYGYSMDYPTITHHTVMFTHYSPMESIWAGTWYMGGFIHGMSGGPITDLNGDVVGVVQRSSEQLGYGVSVETINEFLLSE